MYLDHRQQCHARREQEECLIESLSTEILMWSRTPHQLTLNSSFSPHTLSTEAQHYTPRHPKQLLKNLINSMNIRFLMMLELPPLLQSKDLKISPFQHPKSGFPSTHHKDNKHCSYLSSFQVLSLGESQQRISCKRAEGNGNSHLSSIL